MITFLLFRRIKMKRLEWKQASPQDQIVQITFGIAGYAFNMAEGLYDNRPEKLKASKQTLYNRQNPGCGM